MEGFKRIAYEAFTGPTPTSEAFAEVIDAVHTEADADSLLGVLAGILSRHGFTSEAMKVIRYPSIFCPCVTHETRLTPNWQNSRW